MLRVWALRGHMFGPDNPVSFIKFPRYPRPHPRGTPPATAVENGWLDGSQDAASCGFFVHLEASHTWTVPWKDWKGEWCECQMVLMPSIAMNCLKGVATWFSLRWSCTACSLLPCCISGANTAARLLVTLSWFYHVLPAQYVTVCTHTIT